MCKRQTDPLVDLERIREAEGDTLREGCFRESRAFELRKVQDAAIEARMRNPFNTPEKKTKRAN